MNREQKRVYMVFLRATMHLSGGSNHACLWILTQWIIILHSQMNMVSMMACWYRISYKVQPARVRESEIREQRSENRDQKTESRKV